MDSPSPFGLVLDLLFAGLVIFVSIIWIIFPFIVNARLSKLIAEVTQGNQEVRNLLTEATKTNQHLEGLLAASKKATPASPITRKTAPVPIATAYEPQTLMISQDGKNLGEYTLTNVRHMLKNRTLTLQDLYFDKETNEWMALELNPTFY